MKILMIVNFYNNGGSTLTSYELAKELHKTGNYELSFLGCYLGNMITEFKKLGRVFYGKGPFPNFDYVGKTLYEYDSGKTYYFSQLINELQPDLIHTFVPGHENPQYTHTLPNIPKVCTVLCGQPIGFDPAQFHKVLFLSEYNKRLSNPPNGLVVRPGISNDVVPRRNAPDKPVTFGRISAFCPSKRIMATLVCAQACPESKFIIGGEIQDHDYFKACQELANTLPNVEFYSDITNEKKKLLLNRMDVVHYPSTNEAFCFSILEAMRYGNPYIYFNNSAMPEFAHADIPCGGIPCDDGNIPALVNLTKKIDEWTRNDLTTYNWWSKGVRDTYLKYYTSKIYMDKVETIYKEALNNEECNAPKEYSKSN